jgi:hypothetical protein
MMLQLRKKRTGLGAHPVPLQNAENNLKYRGKTRAFLLTLCQEFWILTDLALVEHTEDGSVLEKLTAEGKRFLKAELAGMEGA